MLILTGLAETGFVVKHPIQKEVENIKHQGMDH